MLKAIAALALVASLAGCTTVTVKAPSGVEVTYRYLLQNKDLKATVSAENAWTVESVTSADPAIKAAETLSNLIRAAATCPVQ